MSGKREQFRRLVRLRDRASRKGIGLESLTTEDLDEQEGVRSADVLERVEQALNALPESERGNPEDFEKARDILRRQGERALAALEAPVGPPLGVADTFAIEAIIIADGTRPSLPVKGSDVDPDHPLAGTWKGVIESARAGQKLYRAVNAVGRIEPANATSQNFFGTGWVVDAGKGLVLTNLHVLEAMARRLPNTMLRTASGFRILSGAYIDFAAETGSPATERYRVVEAIPSSIDGTDFQRLDAAVLKVEPLESAQTLADGLRPVADTDGARGNLASFCVIGFPGPPPALSGFEDGVDWAWVHATLFGGRYGVKRLAPGQIRRPLGSFGDEDPQSWVFGHDATTFGGSSGSVVADWTSSFAAFGLHFAGATKDTNCAHALGAPSLLAELQRLGVPV